MPQTHAVRTGLASPPSLGRTGRTDRRRIAATALAWTVLAASTAPAQDAEGEPPKQPSQVITVRLEPQQPKDKRRMRWSPKGKKLPLVAVGGGLQSELRLGPKGTPPIALRLEKRTPGTSYDTLRLDLDRNGSLDNDAPLHTKPTERRGKTWSSFKTVIDIPITDPWTGKSALNPYPINLWYVEDPSASAMKKVLRFSRQGWMQGTVDIGGTPALILLTEKRMDGVFDREDRWAIAPADKPQQLFDIKGARPVTRHAWLGDTAYRIEELHPSGRKLTLRRHDPGITRAAEAERDDIYAKDRRAKRSGKTVAFLHDFDRAERLAKKQGKPLFIDFETTWCGPCKQMDKWVYNADPVVAASAGLIAVKVDGDDHKQLVKRFEVEAYPTLILLSRDGRVLRRAVGYRGVEAMTKFLRSD